jgi:sensor histidine kinase YesM
MTLLVSFLIARQLTIPIRKIRDSIARLHLVALPDQRLREEKPVSSELEELYASYSEMVVRLQNSLNDIVMIRSHEIQARMLAIQAQMNPHFLYNSITAISIMADNSHQPAIVEMCEASARCCATWSAKAPSRSRWPPSWSICSAIRC